MSRGGRLNTERFGKEKDIVQCKRKCWVLHTVPRSTESVDSKAGRESGSEMECREDTGWNREFGANALDLET